MQIFAPQKYSYLLTYLLSDSAMHLQTTQLKFTKKRWDLWWRRQTPGAWRIQSAGPSWEWGTERGGTCGSHRDLGTCSETPHMSETRSHCAVASQQTETSPTCTESCRLHLGFCHNLSIYILQWVYILLTQSITTIII